MFVEVVLGKARDTSKLLEAWRGVLAVLDEVGDRWQGATAGASDDGTFVALLGFESEEGARNTLDHAAATAQWAVLKELLQGVEFHECPNVRAFVAADLPQAVRLEILYGQAVNAAPVATRVEAAAKAAKRESSIVAGVWCWANDGFAATAIYRHSKGGRNIADKGALAVQSGIDRPTVVALERPWSVFAFGSAPGPRDLNDGTQR